MKERLFLFDVDGTLVDTAGAGKNAIQEAFIEVHGIDAVAMATRTKRFAGMTDPMIFRALAREARISDDRFEESYRALIDCYIGCLKRIMDRDDPARKILPGVLPLLEHLENLADAYLGLLTGNLEEGARIKLEPFGLNRFFPEGGYGSDHADRGEIAAAARNKLSHRNGIRFEDRSVVVIGDTGHDVDCARRNGFRSIAVASGWVGRDTLRQARPDTLLSDLCDIRAVLLTAGWDEDRLPPQLS